MITFTHPTIISAATVQSMLDDETTKTHLLSAIGMSPAARTMRAHDLEVYAIHKSNANLQTLAGVIRNLSEMDIAAIKEQVAAA